MKFGKHVKPRCAWFKAEEVGLAMSGKFIICRHTADLVGDCIHVDGGEVCGLGFIVIGAIELVEPFIDIVSAVLEEV